MTSGSGLRSYRDLPDSAPDEAPVRFAQPGGMHPVSRKIVTAPGHLGESAEDSHQRMSRLARRLSACKCMNVDT